MRPQAGFAANVAQLGHGPRRVLALHCTMAFSGAWKRLANIVSDDFTLIAPDMPSHGQSADWDEISDFSDTAYLASLACLDQPMDIVGHSFGAVIALRLAVEHPSLVRSVTMFEPVFFCAAGSGPKEARLAHDGKVSTIFEALQDGRREEAARLFNRMWGGGSKWYDMPEQTRAAMVRAIHVVPNTNDFLYGDTADLLARLGQVKAPALLVRGSQSLDIVAATNAALAKALPNAKAAVIEGTGHMAPITHPRKFCGIWLDFLGGI